MKNAAVKAWFVYFFTLLALGLMDIDSVCSWYSSKGEGCEEIQKALSELRRVHWEMGIGPWLNRLECAAGFAFEGSYKDKSKCESGTEQREAPSRGQIAGSASFSIGQQRHNLQSDTPLVAHHSGQKPEPRDLNEHSLPATEYPDETADLETEIEDRRGTLVAQTASHEPPGQVALAPLLDGTARGPTPDYPGDRSLQGKSFQNAGDRSVLLVGDSLAHGLALSLGRDLKERDGTAFSFFAKVASGLNNPNVLNWEKTIALLMEKGHPDLVLIMMGVNDANNHIREGKRLCLVGTSEWGQAYEHKVESLLRIVSEHHVRVCWIGVPVVREDGLQNRVALANNAAASACRRVGNCRFVDTYEVLCDSHRHYTNYLQEGNGASVRIRAKDGVHFTAQGGDRLSKYLLGKLDEEEERFHSARNAHDKESEALGTTTRQ